MEKHSVCDECGTSGEIHQTISPELIRRQLEAILRSPMFDASERNRRFLSYIVEETLAGRGNYIKGYSIGISVFGRESSFDPQIDPVVRVEAGRLRRSLERYYLTDGLRARVKISVPKGGYVARFDLLRPLDLPKDFLPPLTAAKNGVHSIFVLPFTVLSDSEEVRRFAFALTDEIAVEFAEHPELAVFMMPIMPVTGEVASSEVLQKGPVRYVFSGSTRVVAGNLRVIAHLIDRIDGRQLWSASFTRDLARPELADLEKEMGHQIVAPIAQYLGKETLATLEH